ncbi:hypothetical protein ACFL0C_01345 [Patescibacteria group bacterium]
MNANSKVLKDSPLVVNSISKLGQVAGVSTLKINQNGNVVVGKVQVTGECSQMVWHFFAGKPKADHYEPIPTVAIFSKPVRESLAAIGALAYDIRFAVRQSYVGPEGIKTYLELLLYQTEDGVAMVSIELDDELHLDAVVINGLSAIPDPHESVGLITAVESSPTTMSTGRSGTGYSFTFAGLGTLLDFCAHSGLSLILGEQIDPGVFRIYETSAIDAKEPWGFLFTEGKSFEEYLKTYSDVSPGVLYVASK